jgi:hypothetical protein
VAYHSAHGVSGKVVVVEVVVVEVVLEVVVLAIATGIVLEVVLEVVVVVAAVCGCSNDTALATVTARSHTPTANERLIGRWTQTRFHRARCRRAPSATR